jgi:small subunit ribosomal protein S9
MARTKKETAEKTTKETKKVKKTDTKVKLDKPSKPVKETAVKAGKDKEVHKENAVEVTNEAVITKQTEEPVVAETKKTPKNSKVKQNLITGTGKRKTAIARVFLYETKGEFTINGVDINEYFPTEQAQNKWMKPFHAIGVAHPTSRFSATIKVKGSGPAAQLSSVVHGFSRALASMNEEFAEVLRKNDLLTRDPRMVERKKYWLRKARKAPQYSKR